VLRPKNVKFVSEIDKFLSEFDATHKKSEAQLAEIQKYKRISELRDKAQPGSKPSVDWEDF